MSANTAKEMTTNNFEEYILNVKNALTNYFGESSQVRISEVFKNNGVKLTGVSILKDESNISPTIYLEKYFSRYKNGESFGDLIFDMVKVYEENSIKENFDMNFFESFENIKNNIVYKLINKEKNQDLLEDIPHVEFLDMAIVFYYIFDENILGNATILIHNSHLKMWGIGDGDLMRAASYNSPKLLSANIRNMEDVLKEILIEKIQKAHEDNKINATEFECILDNIIRNTDKEDYINMYVLSNTHNCFGAACVLYSGLLKEFAGQVESDLIILPSSIHEVIMIPSKDISDYERLKDMVKDVNLTQVDEQEVLSDSVYIFYRDKDEIEMVF